jgi:hypothetical protein
LRQGWKLDARLGVYVAKEDEQPSQTPYSLPTYTPSDSGYR